MLLFRVQFVKHQLKCRHYLRYVDDMEQLGQWQVEIDRFLHRRLMLELRPDALLAPISRGVDFLGYIVRPHYRLVRRRVIGNLHERLQAFEKAHIRRNGGPQGMRLHFSPATLEGLRSTLASYLGHFHHASSQRLIAFLWRKWPWLALLFDYLPHRKGLRPRWQPTQVSGYGSQVRYFRKAFPQARILVQRGCELDDFLPWATDHPIPAPLPELLQGVRQVNVREAGHLRGGLKRRLIDTFYLDPGVNPCRN